MAKRKRTIRLTKALAKRGVFLGMGYASNGVILYPVDMGDDKVASMEAAKEYYGTAMALPRSLVHMISGAHSTEPIGAPLEKSPLVWDDKRLFISEDQTAWIDERYCTMVGMPCVWKYQVNDRYICQTPEEPIYIMPMEDHPADEVVYGMRRTICEAMML